MREKFISIVPGGYSPQYDRYEYRVYVFEYFPTDGVCFPSTMNWRTAIRKLDAMILENGNAQRELIALREVVKVRHCVPETFLLTT